MGLYITTGLGGLEPKLGWLAALLTYSFHALLWAGVVALLVRWRSVPFALRHTAWKLALLAPLVTTSATLSTAPSFGRLFSAEARAPQIALFRLEEPRHETKGARPASGVTVARSRRLLDFFGACLLLGAGLGVARFAIVACGQWRRLGPRRPVHDARLLARLARLLQPLALGPVRLTQSRNIDSPLVLGAREICIPLRTLAALDDAEVDAVLAHELAHLERGDGRWFPLLGLVQAALWFHPVTRWVGVQVRQSAELACDERCLDLTGDPLALARALTRIAADALGAERAVALPTMTQPRSSLVARVARLTNDAGRARTQSSWQARTGLVFSVAVATLFSLTSRIRVADAQPTPATTEHAASLRPKADLGAQLAKLARQAQLLESERAELSSRSALLPAGESPIVRLLEVEQELRHVRQMQTSVEAHAVNDE